MSGVIVLLIGMMVFVLILAGPTIWRNWKESRKH